MAHPNLDETLKVINTQRIQLNYEEVQRNRKLLDHVMGLFLEEFKDDRLFNLLYEKFFYGGSFFDGLKVGKPDEFDIDFVFVLPENVHPRIETREDYDGHVRIRVDVIKPAPKKKRSYNPHSYYVPLYAPQVPKQAYVAKSRELHKLVTDNCLLSISKVTAWFQRLVDIAKHTLGRKGQLQYLESVAVGKPATTLTIKDVYGNTFNVDFVPCFKFDLNQWPEEFRGCPLFEPSDELCKEFFAVPKPMDDSATSDVFFRLSFQGQERRLFENHGHLKPAIRLLKVYRDIYDDTQIKSYYLKTVVLWALEEGNLARNGTLGDTFIQLFQCYIKCIKNRNLLYYWDRNLNFLENCNPDYLYDLGNRLEHHLKDFKNGNPSKINKVFKL